MKNQWLDINLEEYESHMALPTIGQSQYLANFLKESVNRYKPKSVALIGCSGGNGLQNINPEEVKKVVCVDINQNYLEVAKKRYSNVFIETEFIISDITSKDFYFNPVSLIFVGLVFEYVNNEAAVKNLSRLMQTNGNLVVVLQLPNPAIPEVSPSPYKNLEILNELFSFVSADTFLGICKNYGLGLISKKITKLNSGKEFIELVLQKNCD